MCNKLIVTLAVLMIVASAMAQNESASRKAPFLKAKLEVVNVERPLIRIFTTHELLKRSMEVFSDRGNKVTAPIPNLLDGLLYYELPRKEQHSFRAISDGEVLALT